MCNATIGNLSMTESDGTTEVRRRAVSTASGPPAEPEVLGIIWRDGDARGPWKWFSEDTSGELVCHPTQRAAWQHLDTATRYVRADHYSDDWSAGDARAAASHWQSPGRVGAVLASFASGSAVRLDALMQDIRATRPEAATAADVRELDHLCTYALSLSREA